MAISSDFFEAVKKIIVDESFAANKWQKEECDRLKASWETWLDNYPRGAFA
jgi:hypothetical protein